MALAVQDLAKYLCADPPMGLQGGESEQTYKELYVKYLESRERCLDNVFRQTKVSLSSGGNGGAGSEVGCGFAETVLDGSLLTESKVGGFVRLVSDGVEIGRVAGAKVVDSVREVSKSVGDVDVGQVSASVASVVDSMVDGSGTVKECVRDPVQCVRGKNYAKNKARREARKVKKQNVTSVVSDRQRAEDAVAIRKAELALDRLNDPVLRSLSDDQIKKRAIAASNSALASSEASLDKLKEIRPESSASQYEIRQQAKLLADLQVQHAALRVQVSEMLDRLSPEDRKDILTRFSVPTQSDFDYMEAKADEVAVDEWAERSDPGLVCPVGPDYSFGINERLRDVNGQKFSY